MIKKLVWWIMELRVRWGYYDWSEGENGRPRAFAVRVREFIRYEVLAPLVCKRVGHKWSDGICERCHAEIPGYEAA